MQPENTNPNQNPNPGVPQQSGQPGQAPFQRRPIQPIAQRQFAANPAPAPQQPQPQQFAPRPQPVASQPQQAPNPSVNSFAQPAQQQPQFAPRPQQLTPRPAPQQFTQPSTPAESSFSGFTRPARPEVKEKPGLPKGVFALLLFGIGGLAIGILDKSQHNMIFNIIVALDLLLAFGLLFVRKEVVRKAATGLATVTIIASAALVLAYAGLASSTVNAESAFIAEAKKLQNQSPTKQLTDEQQQHLDAMQLQLEAQQKAVGENSTLVYGKYGVTVALYALVALYLTRPKVKEAFQFSEN
jgi:hypothetical protein